MAKRKDAAAGKKAAEAEPSANGDAEPVAKSTSARAENSEVQPRNGTAAAPEQESPAAAVTAAIKGVKAKAVGAASDAAAAVKPQVGRC